MRIVLAGNGLASIYAVDVLMARGFDKILVVAPPGGRLYDWNPSLADHAAWLRLPVLTPWDINGESTLSALERFGPDVLLSVNYPWLFHERLLGIARKVSVNFHPSLLPRYRGVAPLVWQIVNGEEKSGITAHVLERTVDTGDIIAQTEFQLTGEETGFELTRRTASLFRDTTFPLTLDLLARDVLQCWPQAGTPSLYRRHDSVLNEIIWSQPAERIARIIRALAPPFPTAWTHWRGQRVELHRASASNANPPPSAAPGTVMRDEEGWPIVATGAGWLRIDRLSFSGTALDGGVWLRECVSSRVDCRFS